MMSQYEPPEFLKRVQRNTLGKSTIDRFNDNYMPVTESGCWIWISPSTKAGYGQLSVNGFKMTAPRISWLIHRGEIPEGMYLCHKCDERLCVNPNHLFLGTAKDNLHDAMKKGRIKVGEDHYCAKLSNAQREEIRKSPLSNREVAEKYGITKGHAWSLRNKKSAQAGYGEK